MAAVLRGAALALATAMPAQVPLLQAQLAADPARSGPAGLVWLRERVLARHGSGSGLAALEVVLDQDGGLQVRAAAGDPPDGAYLRARFRHGGLSASIRGEADGLETWEIEGGPTAGRLTALVRRLGLDRLRGVVTLDMAALVGNVHGLVDEADPWATLLRLGPGECGAVTFRIECPAPQRTLVRGRSEGGVLLPAVLLLLADLRARPAPPGLDAPSAVAEHEPWQMLAASARGPWREEAAHQLARIGSPPARDALLRLLYADDDARLAAMAALLQRDDREALPKLLAAATPDQPETEALAAIASHTFAHGGVVAPRTASRPPSLPPPTLPPARWIAFSALAFCALALLMAVHQISKTR